MIVRILKKEELMIARDLYCECFLKEKQNLELDLLGNVFGLFVENELIGIIQVDWIHHIFENKKIAYVNSFCIRNDYRNLGYGDYLLKWCIDYCQKNDVDWIQLSSNKNRIYAHKLYEKNGFESIDTILFKKELKKESTLL